MASAVTTETVAAAPPSQERFRPEAKNGTEAAVMILGDTILEAGMKASLGKNAKNESLNDGEKALVLTSELRSSENARRNFTIVSAEDAKTMDPQDVALKKEFGILMYQDKDGNALGNPIKIKKNGQEYIVYSIRSGKGDAVECYVTKDKGRSKHTMDISADELRLAQLVADKSTMQDYVETLTPDGKEAARILGLYIDKLQNPDALDAVDTAEIQKTVDRFVQERGVLTADVLRSFASHFLPQEAEQTDTAHDNYDAVLKEGITDDELSDTDFSTEDLIKKIQENRQANGNTNAFDITDDNKLLVEKAREELKAKSTPSARSEALQKLDDIVKGKILLDATTAAQVLNLVRKQDASAAVDRYILLVLDGEIDQGKAVEIVKQLQEGNIDGLKKTISEYEGRKQEETDSTIRKANEEAMTTVIEGKEVKGTRKQFQSLIRSLGQSDYYSAGEVGALIQLYTMQQAMELGIEYPEEAMELIKKRSDSAKSAISAILHDDGSEHGWKQHDIDEFFAQFDVPLKNGTKKAMSLNGIKSLPKIGKLSYDVQRNLFGRELVSIDEQQMIRRLFASEEEMKKFMAEDPDSLTPEMGSVFAVFIGKLIQAEFQAIASKGGN